MPSRPLQGRSQKRNDEGLRLCCNGVGLRRSYVRDGRCGLHRKGAQNALLGYMQDAHYGHHTRDGRRHVHRGQSEDAQNAHRRKDVRNALHGCKQDAHCGHREEHDLRKRGARHVVHRGHSEDAQCGHRMLGDPHHG